jgi:hypothetical protein
MRGLATDRPQGAAITKGLAPTTGSGSFLPQAASDWPGEEVRGQARGCSQCRPLSSGRRA